ncbi:ATP-binding protein [Azospirillum sp. A39]|uniref:ATP-binding protein n=1 Tax=Azospirillum sp. A39 TaxID=3462279 RepID=UPI004046178E
MRISYRIATVGGIPVAAAAVIAALAGVLLQQAERSREATVLAAAAYRDMITANAARNDFIHAPPDRRAPHLDAFSDASGRVRAALARLAPLAEPEEQSAAVATAQDALDRHTRRMDELVRITRRSDGLIDTMAAQERALLALTEQARRRQHASNVALLDTLAEADRRLRASRTVVDRLHDLREALLRAELAAAPDRPGGRDAAAGIDRVLRTLDAVRPALAQARRPGDAAGPPTGHDVYAAAMQDLEGLGAALAESRSFDGLVAPFETVVERVFKVASTGYNAVQDEVAGLLSYSVTANDVEQETQNVAVRALTFSTRTGRALADRDAGALQAVQEDSAVLVERVAALPVSPLIQDKMLAAVTGWRDGLADTAAGLLHQNGAVAVMDRDADAVIAAARRLNDLFHDRAERSAGLLASVLAVGATCGLILATAAALLVARGITGPLQRLQRSTLRLADDPHQGHVGGVERRDELGDMARAVAHFVAEIIRREEELRQAAARTDATLAELRRTQAHLVQAEKLAALGQLVAGVAHEINTPLGITLSASTLIQERLPKLQAAVEAGTLRRRELERFLHDLADASALLVGSTVRAAELVQRFKQVAVEPAREAHQRFDLEQHLRTVLAGLEPARAAAGVAIRLDCPPGLTVDGYPEAVTQITTHLLTNALTHAYEGRAGGTITVAARAPAPGLVELVYADDGRGIPPEDRRRAFEPFFTTRRDLGFLGLGLHIVYNTLSRIGGTVELDEGPGGGARFVVRLPAAG